MSFFVDVKETMSSGMGQGLSFNFFIISVDALLEIWRRKLQYLFASCTGNNFRKKCYLQTIVGVSGKGGLKKFVYFETGIRTRNEWRRMLSSIKSVDLKWNAEEPGASRNTLAFLSISTVLLVSFLCTSVLVHTVCTCNYEEPNAPRNICSFTVKQIGPQKITETCLINYN